MSKVTADVAHPSWLRQRESAQKISVGHSDRFYKALYSTYYPYHVWDQIGPIRSAVHGGILNIDFSPDGSFIVAGCEKHTLLLFDPLSRKMIRRVNNAHTNCVTNVRFVDSRHFATGSDDSTVALWDARNLKTQVRILLGHSNSVRDIEYSPKDGLLVTSGFDGNVYTWDFNNYEDDFCQKVFYAEDLLRTRLTPDGSKMVLSTSRGYLMVVHDLDLHGLARDLDGFDADASRQRLQQVGPAASSFLLFSRRARNRVELVTDFPREDDSTVVSSLALHPAGAAALTRGSSEALALEWTCVHDLRDQGLPAPDDPESDDEAELQLEAQCLAAAVGGPHTPPGEPPLESEREQEEEEEGEPEEGEPESARLENVGMELGEPTGDNPSGGEWPGSSVACCSRSDGGDVVPVSGQATRALDDEGALAGARAAMGDDERVPMLQSSPGRGEGSRSPRHFAAPAVRPKKSRIFQYTPRLTHFIEERSTGKWYMKEFCFSPDGRLMGAPFGCGVRIFAFTPECSELSVCVPRTHPLPLHELVTNFSHNSIVICTKFSPRHCLFVSGCFSGNIVWYQPFI